MTLRTIDIILCTHQCLLFSEILTNFARSRHPFFEFLIRQPAIARWQKPVWQAGEQLPTTLQFHECLQKRVLRSYCMVKDKCQSSGWGRERKGSARMPGDPNHATRRTCVLVYFKFYVQASLCLAFSHPPPSSLLLAFVFLIPWQFTPFGG